MLQIAEIPPRLPGNAGQTAPNKITEHAVFQNNIAKDFACTRASHLPLVQ